MDYEKPLFFELMEYASTVDRDVIDMVSGNPDWDVPPALREGLEEYSKSPVSAFQYPPSEGLRSLREEISARRNVPIERVVITNGAGEANHLAMSEALSQTTGSNAVLIDPVYPYYVGRVNLLGIEPRFVAAEADGSIQLGAVRDVVNGDTAFIAINTPNNPTGAVYPESTMRELVAIAEANDAYVVSDEVYDHFDYSGNFASGTRIKSGRMLVTNSFSKSLAITGFRVGYGIYPQSIVDRIKTRHMLTNVTGSRPAQYAVQYALQHTNPTYYARNRGLIQERVSVFTAALDDINAEYWMPDGAFYVLVKFNGFPGTLENVKRLISDGGIAGMPGETFGSAASDAIRFALVTPRVQEAANRLASYFL